MTPRRGALLDVDGTLIDSNDAHAEAWADVLREFGYEVPVDQLRPMIGMGGDKLLPKVTGLEHESDLAKRIEERRAEIFTMRYLPTLHAFPCAHELLARFKESGLELVIATSSDAEQLNAMLEQTGLDELVERKTSSSDADRSKPDPDIIEAALKKGRLAPNEALMLGDTPYDIDAASAAGVGTVALRSGGWPDRALRGAVAIYDDAEELFRKFDESPFATRTPETL
ncbi:MAG: hydrolase, haloacid dehalogenase-like family [Gemmatimonadetes bacterium]|nr:hydrolase, haloacid dehalogenase-like family [Gemmatimonadota bacterium]